MHLIEIIEKFRPREEVLEFEIFFSNASMSYGVLKCVFLSVKVTYKILATKEHTTKY